jgi:hypothetical protein
MEESILSDNVQRGEAGQFSASFLHSKSPQSNHVAPSSTSIIFSAC